MFGRVVGSGGASPVWSDDTRARDEPRVVGAKTGGERSLIRPQSYCRVTHGQDDFKG
ncbi:hypothetical protein M2359_003800 [Gordonia amarae]|nr:hypothetical protein [Gordonia amarae]